ncbi:cuticle protein 21-like [Musca vetustissima]|uniref:cuticle protein 21-like n=1 Tax=Musca vetustissima TaxID=27455 RepID=UPI002AB6B010|nr:cuticle protein 21-like [Musca vetustissima]
MMHKLLIVSALLAVASAVLLPAPVYPSYAGVLPAIGKIAKVVGPEPYDTKPQYSYSYDVNDPTTGDVKSQQETRDGDNTKGAYSLIEPDGTRLLIMILSALIAVASAVVLPAPIYPAYAGVLPAIGKIAKVVGPEPYDAKPQYSYSYDVNDPKTGDIKSQQETRDGDNTKGAYSLIEPDGTRLLVEYTVDPIGGFNAVVQREGAAKVAKVLAPVAKILTPAPLYQSPILAKPLLQKPLLLQGLPSLPTYPALGSYRI